MFAFHVRAAICGVLLFCISVAGTAETETLDVPGAGKVPYQRLFQETSKPGETLDAFVLRIAPRLRAYSDETGFEACGTLSTDGERFSIVVGSVGSRLACVSGPRMDGHRSAGATLHSHGKQGRFAPNRQDVALSSGVFTSGRERLQTIHGQALNAFSDQDIASGPGYLAGTNGRVLFQGKGTFREVHPSP